MKRSLFQILSCARNKSSFDCREIGLKERDNFTLSSFVESLASVFPRLSDLRLERDVSRIHSFINEMESHPEGAIFNDAPKVVMFAPVEWEKAGMEVEGADPWDCEQV